MSLRALLVDDDAAILEVLEMRLEAMGFEVRATSDPRHAIEALSRQPFDVALFDLRMDSMDGISLTREALERQGRLPILIMTAHASIDTAVAAIKQGAFDYMTKPFDAGELQRKLARAIAARRWARDRELLSRLGETLASSSTMERTLSAVARATLEATESESAHVFLADGGPPTLSSSAGAAPRSEDEIHDAAKRVIAEATPIRVGADDEHSVLAVPLLVEGVGQGALVVETRASVVATGDDLETLSLFAGQAAVALRNAQELSRLRSDALTALGRVATQVAHDLNNPLNGLRLQACVLGERFERSGDEAGLAMTQKMDRTIDHLAGLVTDILSFGRQRDLKREPVDLEALVGECLSPLSDRCQRQGIRVRIDVGEPGRSVLLDATEIRRALTNLIQNALDAMPDGGELRVEAHRAGDALEIVVRDDGIGMDEKTAARMADLFFTTKDHGTGLGTAIVHTAIERHGGRVSVTSEPGRGTSIRLEVPL